MNNGPIILSLILPVYNEARDIGQNILALQQKLEQLKLSYELIVVNDGSTDGTWRVLSSCASERVRIFSNERNTGKGYAVKTGMLQARGQFCAFMDADLSVALDAIEDFLETLKNGGCDIVIGTRRARASEILVGQPFYRRFLGKGFTLLSRAVTGLPCSDFTCGFKMFTNGAAKAVFPRQTVLNWAFDTEILYIAKSRHLRIREAPVKWRNRPRSRVSLISDIFSSFFSLGKIAFDRAFNSGRRH